MDRKQPQGGSRMATQNNWMADIIDGPSEMDFFYSLARQIPVMFKFRNKFTSADGMEAEVIITGIEDQDGKAKIWHFKGHLKTYWNRFAQNTPVSGWFSYKHHRKGYIEIGNKNSKL
jgi:hypothetical protein